MATRVTFANYPNGLQPIPAALDTAFDDVLKLTIIPCTATGTNTIALTPIASVYPPDLTAYANYSQFSFVPANSTTGSATVNVNGVGAKNLYLNDGTTRVGSGDLVAGRVYTISYSSALNSSAGGFYVSGSTLVSPTFTGTVTAAAANFSGAVDVAGNFSVATNKLTVAAASGNTLVAGTLSATGNLAINTNKFNITAASGNTAVAGTVSVADATEATSTVAASVMLAGGLGIVKKLFVGGAANIAGILDSIAHTITSASATAFAVGRLGTTTPALLVDASTATSITGVSVKSAATGGGVALAAIGETNVALTINGAGSGTIGIGSVSTGRVTITPVTTITGALTLSAALTYGGVTLSNAVTGTGNMVLSASPTFTGTVTAAALTATGLLDLSGASAGQISFPATQNASAGANTLDDYEKGTWTPVLTFATPGNLSVSYTLQTGTYTKVGRQVSVSYAVLTSAFTHTTASGNLNVTGAPFTAGNATQFFGSCAFSGITKAGYGSISPRLVSNAIFDFIASGSGVAFSNVATTDTPTGGTILLGTHMTYHV